MTQAIIKPALFDAQLARTMGFTSYQGAEIGECLAIADKVANGDKEVWYKNWLHFADKNYAIGELCRKQRLFSDGKNAFLRASNYYRTAFFFLEDNPSDKRIDEAMKMSINSFHNALELFNYPVEKVTILFDGIDLPAYLYINCTGDKLPKPILIDTGGGDGTKEESYFNVANEALEHGMHCLCFEGPGQGSVLRLNKIPFIPDWERVIEKVVDFVINRPEVDTQRIYLIGKSFGGYLASRAVSGEKRIAACIVDPGIFDSSAGMESKFRKLAEMQFPEFKDAPIHKIIEHVMELDSTAKFMFNSRKWRFGVETIEELVKVTKHYTVNGFAQNIECPMLVCDNTLEYITQGQAKILYNALKCPKQYILFNDEDGTGGHCEPLAPRLFSAKMYEWLTTI